MSAWREIFFIRKFLQHRKMVYNMKLKFFRTFEPLILEYQLLAAFFVAFGGPFFDSSY